MTDFNDVQGLVARVMPEYFTKLSTLITRHQACEREIKEIVALAVAKQLLPFPYHIRFFEYTFPVDTPLSPIFEDDITIYYDRFTLDRYIMEKIVFEAVESRMQEEFIPYPQSMIIGAELQRAVVRGKLPKRFEITINGVKLRYDSGISGVAFL